MNAEVKPLTFECWCKSKDFGASKSVPGHLAHSTIKHSVTAATAAKIHFCIPGLQGIHDLFTDNQNIKLSEWMIVTGVVAWLFTMLVSHPRLTNIMIT